MSPEFRSAYGTPDPTSHGNEIISSVVEEVSITRHRVLVWQGGLGEWTSWRYSPAAEHTQETAQIGWLFDRTCKDRYDFCKLSVAP